MIFLEVEENLDKDAGRSLGLALISSMYAVAKASGLSHWDLSSSRQGDVEPITLGSVRQWAGSQLLTFINIKVVFILF